MCLFGTYVHAWVRVAKATTVTDTCCLGGRKHSKAEQQVDTIDDADGDSDDEPSSENLGKIADLETPSLPPPLPPSFLRVFPDWPI